MILVAICGIAQAGVLTGHHGFIATPLFGVFPHGGSAGGAGGNGQTAGNLGGSTGPLTNFGGNAGQAGNNNGGFNHAALSLQPGQPQQQNGQQRGGATSSHFQHYVSHSQPAVLHFYGAGYGYTNGGNGFSGSNEFPNSGFNGGNGNGAGNGYLQGSGGRGYGYYGAGYGFGYGYGNNGGGNGGNNGGNGGNIGNGFRASPHGY